MQFKRNILWLSAFFFPAMLCAENLPLSGVLGDSSCVELCGYCVSDSLRDTTKSAICMTIVKTCACEAVAEKVEAQKQRATQDSIQKEQELLARAALQNRIGRKVLDFCEKPECRVVTILQGDSVQVLKEKKEVSVVVPAEKHKVGKDIKKRRPFFAFGQEFFYPFFIAEGSRAGSQSFRDIRPDYPSGGVGLFFRFYVFNSLFLQTGTNASFRSIAYRYTGSLNDDNFTVLADGSVTWNAFYVEWPILVNVKIGDHFHFITGIQMNYKASSNVDVGAGLRGESSSRWNDIEANLKNEDYSTPDFEFYWVGGIGIDASRFFGLNFKILYGGGSWSDDGAIGAPEWNGRISLYWMI